ncbi:3,4-dihydroxy-2-butanone 4-phosphate synthase / GTP cyclohydrolase II [Aequoribacter fuscus]|uniref:3,4-dihydroxy-2-butanone 4-phosphate synthase n=1 Tax=Aequoribacter fuscus TaxID=2518989 RepID=F3L5Q1_9GAMM|nr:3,4-dihydroxy-2-butanone-4-phosphate synthase [Aequoribacter fuscus]EGG28341.1 3,4-dihydroxy-2-butanone 4-phosphate synthase / GTP cyclohydrolase II [Aequoribacter fuscus]QHJ87281.1 3,4-dihydroxy-2-butanone-4-phosphate synthase [Aequoribacter fuscus]
MLNTVDELIADLRRGHMVVLVDDDKDSSSEGVVMVAADHITANHVNFMARRAKGLVCLALTKERCRQLNLPLMAENTSAEKTNFTLSIEARHGIDTGISAADRALTVQVAVAPNAKPEDIVQPGHIFPLTAEDGGVLNRAGHTEAAADYARLAGCSPSAVIADILASEGYLADGEALREFAKQWDLKIGSIADLIHFRLSNERTIEREREGTIHTKHGEFNLVAYRDRANNLMHIALTKGAITADTTVPVRMHVQSILRDIIGTQVADVNSWDASSAIAYLAQQTHGVAVILANDESSDTLLHSVDMALGTPDAVQPKRTPIYSRIGTGSQILKDLGVRKISLLGAPMKYNALSGFDLEVNSFIDPSGTITRVEES